MTDDTDEARARLKEAAGEAAGAASETFARTGAANEDAWRRVGAGAARNGARGVDVAAKATRAMVDGAREMNEASADFIARRLRRDMEAARAFAGSRTMADAIAAQTDFFETALRDYAAHSARLFDIAGGWVREAAGASDSVRPD